MNREEKQLLITDLCARLPYGVKMEAYPLENPHEMTIKDLAICQIMTEPYKPYLRPMSSMTKREREEFGELQKGYLYRGVPTEEFVSRMEEFYNSHYLDFRGLIGKGLALEAKKDMYKID